jgi:hypothetical protein
MHIDAVMLFVAYLASMAVIGGAKTADEVINTVKAGFFSVIRVRTHRLQCSLTLTILHLRFHGLCRR